MVGRIWILVIVTLLLGVQGRAFGADAGSEWQRIIAAAKKEGKVVIGAPPGNDFRNEVQAVLKKRFDLDSEFIQAPGPNLMSKIVAEKQAGAATVDAFLVGPCTGNTLLKTDLFEPLTAAMILPEVKDPAKWFGGHLWADNQTGKNLLYSFVAQVTPSIYYNTQLVKPQEVRSYNDLLDPKWKGKIGLRDPRVPGGGLAMWAFLLDMKGEEYIKKLAQQDMFVGRNARQIADALAKGNLALTIGVGYRDFDAFLDANLPVKHLPTLKEGTYVSGGNGIVGVIKGAPHPNAAKVFQLVAQPGRSGTARKNSAATDPALGRGYQGLGRPSRQRCHDFGRVQALSKLHRGQVQQFLVSRSQVG
jgi:iron(III) transport system substrate-binding protein